MDCERVKQMIDEMFVTFTPIDVAIARAELAQHLLKCEFCRAYLKESYCKKKEESKK